MPLTVLTSADLVTYRREGFLLAKGVLPPELLQACQSVLEKWVDGMVAEWMAKGLLKDAHEDLDFRSRYLVCWREAGQPNHPRSPRKPLVELDPVTMFDVLRHPALLNVAQDLIGSEDLVSHGIWNSRPKAPDARFTDTPWHQDAQYFRNQAGTHIVTIWFPLHDVSVEESCLAVAPGHHRDHLYENNDDAGGTGFIGLKREDSNVLETHPVAMEAWRRPLFL